MKHSLFDREFCLATDSGKSETEIYKQYLDDQSHARFNVQKWLAQHNVHYTPSKEPLIYTLPHRNFYERVVSSLFGDRSEQQRTVAEDPDTQDPLLGLEISSTVCCEEGEISRSRSPGIVVTDEFGLSIPPSEKIQTIKSASAVRPKNGMWEQKQDLHSE